MAIRIIPEEFTVPIRDSANRPHLRLGCEPSLLGLAGIGTAFMAIFLQSLYGVLFSIGVFLVLLFVFRQLAQYDPHFMKIWRDSKRWKQGFWLAVIRPQRVGNVTNKKRR